MTSVFLVLALLEMNLSTLFARFLARAHEQRSELIKTTFFLSHLDLFMGMSCTQ